MKDDREFESGLNNWTDKERIANVRKIFDTITPQYDLMNRVLSGRRDVAWRRFTAKQIPPDSTRFLDVATGTSDLGIDVCKRHRKIKVTGLDFSLKMMEAGREKVSRMKLSERIGFIAADATNLPFGDDYFDAAGAAFGIRNMPDKCRVLEEMKRVVKPGGKILILEMTFPRNSKLRWFFRWYFKNIIPLIGSLIAGNRRAYQYLPDSIHDFLHPDEMTGLFSEAGLQMVRAYPLSFGVTYLHEGVVPGTKAEAKAKTLDSR